MSPDPRPPSGDRLPRRGEGPTGWEAGDWHEAFDFGMALDGRHVENIRCRACLQPWPCQTDEFRRLVLQLAFAVANEETALRHVRDLEDLIRAHGDEGLILRAAQLYDTEATDD